jgi:hypothetical protein
MKKLSIAAIACLCSTVVHADPLTDQDKAYIIAATASLVVLAKCPHYKAVTNSLQVLGDKLGVDSDTIGPALVNAMQMSAGGDYDRSMLIPEVTRTFNTVAESLSNDVTKNTAKFCSQWGSSLIERGLVEKDK